MVRFSLLLALFFAGTAAGQALGAFFKDTFEEYLRHRPEFATFIGRNDYDDRWTDWSKAGRAMRRDHLQRRLEELKRFPPAGQTEQDRVTARLVEYDLRSQLDADDIETHLLKVGQLYGLHNVVYLVIDRMPARTVRDYENILARLKAVPVYVEQNLGLLDESIARRIMQPRIVAEVVGRQIEAQMKQDGNSTPLLDAFREFPSNIPQAEQARLRGQAAEVYDKQFIPAWRKLHGYITGKYAASVRPRDSIGSMPGGREAYAILVREMTTTSMTPEAIHSLGEREVKRIEAEMQGVAAEAGFKGSIGEFERHITTLPEQHFRDKDDMLAYCRNISKIIEPELPNQFKRLPMLLYGVRAIPPDREAAMASNAEPPTPDYGRPGWFNLNTYEPQKQLKYDKAALVLHEAVPGHIFQITLAQGLAGMPDIRKFYFNSAFGEGWALYAESLGSQLGVYRDPYSRFGQLASERFRAVRLVVDTGIHALGWTRDQAIAYFREHAPDEPVSEVDRYISWPGQALSYKIGQLKIRELRNKAEQRQGEKFDIREFHDAVLRNGTLPLDLLENAVNEYLGTGR